MTSFLSCGHQVEQVSKNRNTCKTCAHAYYEQWRRAKGKMPREAWLASVRSPTWCPDCSTEKPLSEFNRDRSRPLGYQNICKACQKVRINAWRARAMADPIMAERIRRRNNAATKHYRHNPVNADKIAAHQMVNAAIRLGILTAKPCEKCGATPSDAHHDNYRKPLDVRWLCRRHHKEHHLNQP